MPSLRAEVWTFPILPDANSSLFVANVIVNLVEKALCQEESPANSKRKREENVRRIIKAKIMLMP